MKTAAIISEYNPFHNGHQYQIEQLRVHHGITHIVCIMNGSFMQRGEPAIYDKFSRAESALKGGADLVVELPYRYGAQTAEIFACGGVGLAHKLGIDVLSFGCENNDLSRFSEAVTVLNREPEAYRTVLYSELELGNSYANSRLKALEAVTSKDFAFLTTPNNILALEYLRQIDRFNSSMQIIPILRTGVAYDSDEAKGSIASASHIRKLLHHNEYADAFRYMPPEAYNKERTRKEIRHKLNDYRWILKAKLITIPTEKLSTICDMEVGLEHRFKKHAELLNEHVDRFIDEVSGKRYTKSRIRRILVNLMMDYTNDDRNSAKNNLPSYARILGMNQKGQDLINQIRMNDQIKIITNIRKQHNQLSTKDLKSIETETIAYDLYHLFSEQIITDIKNRPIVIGETKNEDY